VAASVKTLSDTLATFQSGAFSKLDAISGSVDAARADLARLRTDVAAMASVVAGIQTTVSRVDTNVGGLVDTAKTIATTVDSINKAVPGLATKADVSGAQTAITGAVDKAKSDLQSAVKSAEDTASTSSRNWGVINTILIFIAIAILAYSTFVARRA
jgi:t-SNARE complex subunit (syntaxin)